LKDFHHTAYIETVAWLD